MRRKLALTLLMLLATSAALADCTTPVTWYLSPLGGTPTQCTGLSPNAYDGSGVGEACAINHPHWYLKPGGPFLSGVGLLEGCDTLIVDDDNGAYEVGYYGNPNVGSCADAWAYECFLQAIPDGTAANPTRILGEHYADGCATKPEIYGSGRLNTIFDISGSANIELQCLEITDHAHCTDAGTNEVGYDYGCNNSSPYSDDGVARVGIRGLDASEVYMNNMYIHGLAIYGIQTGRMTNWLIENSTLEGTGASPFQGDYSQTDNSNSGYIYLRNVTLEWGGCLEEYPIVSSGHDRFDLCGAQGAFGYQADGVELGHILTTVGNWFIIDSSISYNVYDGFDGLHGNGQGETKAIRSKFMKNGGNQFKVANDAYLEDVVVDGQCSYHYQNNKYCQIADGCTENVNGSCRAGGQTISVTVNKAGQTFEMINVTAMGEGDVLLQAAGSSCDGTEQFISRNGVYIGSDQWDSNTGAYYTSDDIDDFYNAGSGACLTNPPTIDRSNDLWVNFKTGPAASGSILVEDPVLDGLTVTIGASEGSTSRYTCADSDDCTASGGLIPGTSSPLRDFADETVTGILETVDAFDLNGFDRSTSWDSGAYEFGSTATTIGDCEIGACEFCLIEAECASAECYWYNSTCNTTPATTCSSESCTVCANQSECESASCYWYDSQCNQSAQATTATTTPIMSGDINMTGGYSFGTQQ